MDRNGKKRPRALPAGAAWMRLGERVLDLLFPPRCPLCDAVTDTPDICPACRRTMPRIPDASAVTAAGQSRCAAPLWYSGRVREALLALKFSGESHVARGWGRILAECASEHFSAAFDTVTWVPVSRQRLRQRGYDQARLLAESACRHWETRPVALLVKTEDNPAQSGLAGRRARAENVSGVYAPAPGAEISGRRVLLIDDIHTTGATLAECVRVLHRAGAEAAVCLTAARTPPGDGGDGKKSPLPSCDPEAGGL